MTTEILSISGLKASYGSLEVLHGIDLSVRRGRITALLGPNGAGKTTTMRAICQLGVRTSGSVVFDGEPIDRSSTEAIAKRGISAVPDGRGTFLRFTVDENLRIGAWGRSDRAGIAADRERMFAWFPRLKERLWQAAGTLSGGEQQMLAIARALMAKPRLLLLDEPSFGLAPKVVRDLFAVVSQVNAELGVSVLVVEQNAAMALAMAHDACLLETGRVVLSGKSAELAQDSRVRHSYLGH
jgi:branched-chain amino acid transport system ATP-binding protein